MSFNIQQAMKKAQDFQKQMQKLQDSLADVVVEGISGGGAVIWKMTCKGEARGLTIDPSVSDDLEIMSDLILAAYNNARKKADDTYKGESDKLASSFGISPDMLKNMGL